MHSLECYFLIKQMLKKIISFKEIMQENKGKLFMLGYKSLNSVLGERDRWVNLVLSFS